MIQSKMIENEEEIVCFYKHKFPVQMIACDIKLEKNKKLLCSECLDILESEAKLMSFKKTLQNIVEYQNLKKESVENVVMINIKQIESLLKQFHQLKSNVVQQLDQLIGNLNEWINHLIILAQSNLTYSFYEELDKLINQTKFEEFNYKPLIHQIIQINQSCNQKILKQLDLFKSFQETQKCEEILKLIQNLNQIDEKNQQQKQIQDNLNNEIQQQQQIIQEVNQQIQPEVQLMIQNQLQLKLIDDSNKQDGLCYAIAFDQTGSIMISCENGVIKIWNFEQGKLKLSNSYQIHKQAVTCLVYSKQRNNFISGSRDNTIICWQQIKPTEWKSSKPFQQHKNDLNCLMLNKQEDQLISGSSDKSIKVWKVDFIKNELTFLQSLDSHTNSVESFSYNESETMLTSCGYGDFIIWEKGLQGKWKLKYKQDVSNYGRKIHFINDQQFIWVTESKDIDDIFVFEQQNGVFKQNSNKTIKLIQNNKCKDYFYFPIIHNKERNMILVRHKEHIYLIRQLKDQTFNIILSLNCQIREVYGAMTNNGQYLVLWDNKNEKYSSYEILNK